MFYNITLVLDIMGFNGTTNGDTVGFHMIYEGYNDYTCVYIYTTYMGWSWGYFSGCKPGEITSKGWDSAPPLTIMK